MEVYDHIHFFRVNDPCFRTLYTDMVPCASLQNLEYSDRNLMLVGKNGSRRKCALIELDPTWCTVSSLIFAWALAIPTTVRVFASSPKLSSGNKPIV